MYKAIESSFHASEPFKIISNTSGSWWCAFCTHAPRGSASVPLYVLCVLCVLYVLCVLCVLYVLCVVHYNIEWRSYTRAQYMP